MHSLGLWQCPFFGLQPTEQRAGSERKRRRKVNKMSCEISCETSSRCLLMKSSSSLFFLANTDWQYPISEDGEIKYFKTNKAHGKKFILKNGSDPVCIQQMPGRRSNSGITHCGNKYQKKKSFSTFWRFFRGRIWMSGSLILLSFSSPLRCCTFNKWIFAFSCSFSEVKLDNICSPSWESVAVYLHKQLLLFFILFFFWVL